MPDIQDLVGEFVVKLKKPKIEGSHATARHTDELLWSVISAALLLEAVKTVGEQLIAASPVEFAVENIVRRVLHIIREEDLNLVTKDTG